MKLAILKFQLLVLHFIQYTLQQGIHLITKQDFNKQTAVASKLKASKLELTISSRFRTSTLHHHLLWSVCQHQTTKSSSFKSSRTIKTRQTAQFRSNRSRLQVRNINARSPQTAWNFSPPIKPKISGNLTHTSPGNLYDQKNLIHKRALNGND